MEEEGGDDSEMIDAMDGWDSEDDSNAQTSDSANTGEQKTGAAAGEAEGKKVAKVIDGK